MRATELALPVLGGSRVLVVDDGADSAAALTALLRLNNFDAHAAPTAAAALDAVARRRPHVVVLDLTLPDGDGVDLIGRLRAAATPPAVVVVSGRTDPATRHAATAAGAAAFVLKPAEPKELVSLVARLSRPAA